MHLDSRAIFEHHPCAKDDIVLKSNYTPRDQQQHNDHNEAVHKRGPADTELGHFLFAKGKRKTFIKPMKERSYTRTVSMRDVAIVTTCVLAWLPVSTSTSVSETVAKLKQQRPLTMLANLTFSNVSSMDSWLRAAPANGSLIPVWYPLNTNWRYGRGKYYMSNPTRKPYFVYSVYDKAHHTIRFLDNPCGYIPSEGCFRSMLNISIRGSRSVKDCDKTAYSPILQNIPRWGINITIQRPMTYVIDSQNLIYLGLSTIIQKIFSKENCSRNMVYINALQKNLFSTSQLEDTRITQLFQRLRIPKSVTSNKYRRSNASAPMTARQFSDYGILSYYFLSLGQNCIIRELYERQIEAGNRTMLTRYGPFDISSLYETSPPNASGVAPHFLNQPHILSFVQSIRLKKDT